MYFDNCKTPEEVKARYKELAKLHHPDLGGDTATMQAINTEYAFVSDRVNRSSKPGKSEAEYANMAEVDERLRQVIARIINLNATIEIIGLWIWISDTRQEDIATRDTLKAAKFRWASKKQMWYFAGVPASNRRDTSIHEIRARYGSELVKTASADEQKQVTA